MGSFDAAVATAAALARAVTSAGDRARRFVPSVVSVQPLSFAATAACAVALLLALPEDARAAGSATPAPAGPNDALIRELDLVVSPTPSRELPGWRPSKRVYLRASDSARLPALRAAAPGAEFVLIEDGAKSLPPADVAMGVCSPAVFAASPDVAWVQLLSHGVDGCMRVLASRERKPVVTAGKGGVTAPVADHAMALVLAHARGLDWYGAQQRNRRWADDTTAALKAGEMQPERELRGSTMLIYGLGGIGTEIARRAHAFDMRVVGIRASGRTGPDYVAYVGLPDELHRLAAEADYVVNVAPLTDATRKVFDERFFAALKPGAFFVTVGRGPSTDLDALVRALKSGRLGGAGLDVTDPEPLPADHPLWTMPKVIITPHSAGATVDGLDRRWKIAVENLRRWNAGEPLIGVVDTAKGY